MIAIAAVGGLLCGIPVGFIVGVICMGWADAYVRGTDDLDYSDGM